MNLLAMTARANAAIGLALATTVPSLLAAPVTFDQGSDPVGFVVTGTTVFEAGTEISTLAAPIESNGFRFAFWDLNGVRQDDLTGRGLNQVRFAIIVNTTATAHYFDENEDSDGDSVPDWFEWQFYPSLANGSGSDTDGDGLSLLDEYERDLHPRLRNEVRDGGISRASSSTVLFIVPPDIDGDGLPNDYEDMFAFLDPNDPNDAALDQDNDGLSNLEEFQNNTEPENPDTDGDGLNDVDEVKVYRSNPKATDSDGDGLEDGDEVHIYNTNPASADSDGDGLDDGAEINTHLTGPNDPDSDGDGLKDGAEVKIYRSNPTLTDTDGDGFDDGFEVSTGFDPASETSTPDALSSIRTAVEFRFNAANGQTYRVEASTDLENWTTIEDGIAGNGGVVVRFYSTENPARRFFRARRE